MLSLGDGDNRHQLAILAVEVGGARDGGLAIKPDSC